MVMHPIIKFELYVWDPEKRERDKTFLAMQIKVHEEYEECRKVYGNICYLIIPEDIIIDPSVPEIEAIKAAFIGYIKPKDP